MYTAYQEKYLPVEVIPTSRFVAPVALVPVTLKSNGLKIWIVHSFDRVSTGNFICSH